MPLLPLLPSLLPSHPSPRILPDMEQIKKLKIVTGYSRLTAINRSICLSFVSDRCDLTTGVRLRQSEGSFRSCTCAIMHRPVSLIRVYCEMRFPSEPSRRHLSPSETLVPYTGNLMKTRRRDVDAPFRNLVTVHFYFDCA